MIILASNSQTRAKILKSYNVDFIQKSVFFDEDALSYTNPSHFVYHATMGKMNAYVDKFGIDTMPVLCADTVVTCRGRILRKAKNEDDAREILSLQSGNIVSILTCMILKSKTREFYDLSSTDYVFAEFEKDELQKYLKSGEWKDKAGACMVEGFCKPYIKEVRGYESTAMGLCIEKLLPYIED